MRFQAIVLATGLLLFLSSPGRADRLELRSDCTGVPGPCYTDLAALLAEIHAPTGGRVLPGPTNPVLVDIGPGTFDLSDITYPYCDGLSHLTFRGAGANLTVLTGGGYPSESVGAFDLYGPYTMLIRSCDLLRFENLAIVTEAGTTNSAIRFIGDGSTWWAHLRIEAQRDPVGSGPPLAWNDSGESATDASVHYWSDTTFVSRAGGQAAAFWASGSTHRITESVIEVHAGFPYAAVFATGKFDIEIRSSSILAHGNGSGEEAIAFLFNDPTFYPSCAGSRFRMEGSAVEVRTDDTTYVGQGVYDYCDGSVTRVVRGTSWTLGPLGTLKRFRQGSQRWDAPNDLGSGANPPAWVTGVFSRRGLDTFLEIDCSAALCSDTPQGTASHLLSFDPDCTSAGPWFDTATQACRGP